MAPEAIDFRSVFGVISSRSSHLQKTITSEGIVAITEVQNILPSNTEHCTVLTLIWSITNYSTVAPSSYVSYDFLCFVRLDQHRTDFFR